MSKVMIEHEIMYEIGDVVIFEHDHTLLVGVVDGYYINEIANNTVWYHIRTWEDHVFLFSNGGDIPEWDILYKIEGKIPERIKKYILSGEWEEEDNE